MQYYVNHGKKYEALGRCTSIESNLIKEIKMKYHVFNKKPSRSAIEYAAKSSSDPQEQLEHLAISTFPEKGELWQNVNTGRVLVIRSKHIPIQGTPTGVDVDAIDCFGVVVADIINGEVDFDIFFTLRQLLQYKKIGRLKLK